MNAHGIAVGWVSEKIPHPERAERIHAAPSGLNLIVAGTHGDAMGFHIESRWDKNNDTGSSLRGFVLLGDLPRYAPKTP